LAIDWTGVAPLRLAASDAATLVQLAPVVEGETGSQPRGPHRPARAARRNFHRLRPVAACAAGVTFERAWAKRCPGVVTSLREDGDELLTFFRFPKAQ
jgi:hypothetical protein